MKKILFWGLISAIIFSNINAISDSDSDNNMSSARNTFIELRRDYNSAQSDEQRAQILTELRRLSDSLVANVDENTTRCHINRFINSVTASRSRLNSVRNHLAAQFAAVANRSGNSSLSLFSPETAMSGVQNPARRNNLRFPFELGREGAVHSGLHQTASDSVFINSFTQSTNDTTTSRQDQEASSVQQSNNAPRNAQQIAREINSLVDSRRHDARSGNFFDLGPSMAAFEYGSNTNELNINEEAEREIIETEREQRESSDHRPIR